MWRLLRPLKYFALINREKYLIDIFGALFIGAMIFLPFALVDGAAFFRSGGLLDRIGGLAATLTGFYVAALVAAATFSHADLDKEMEDGAVYRRVHDGEGVSKKERLTRRELACEIFGYLAFASLLFAVTAAISVPIANAVPNVPSWANDQIGDLLIAAHPWARQLAMAAASLMLGHILTVTGLGIYYLTDRLHYHTPTVVSQYSDPKSD